ncbi:hypothetical protein [Microbispora sp. NPDC049125]|uniref:hypothetical protein n=1 Tax=Microbispora sp. NPDC049125 TaxID=3154929 RepID=UPI003466D433
MTIDEARDAVVAAELFWREHENVLKQFFADGFWDNNTIDERGAWYARHRDVWGPYMDLIARRTEASQVLMEHGIHPQEVATG